MLLFSPIFAANINPIRNENYEKIDEEMPKQEIVCDNGCPRSGDGNASAYLSDTIAAVFSEVYSVDVLSNTNRELFASNNPAILARMEENAARCSDPALRAMLERISRGLAQYEAGDYRMTDDCAPVELLGMRVIDELIRDEVAWYKQLYKEYGLKALIGSL